MSEEAEIVGQLAEQLVRAAGGYLRTTLRPLPQTTCSLCDAPVGGGWSTCYKCGQIYGRSPLAADLVGSMIYAVRGRQSGYMMRGYKAAAPVQEHIRRVGSLLWTGISHRQCASKLIGAPVTHWASVPSLPSKPGQHMLNRLAERNPFMKLPEIRIAAAEDASDLRAFRPSNFVVESVVPRAHVLLLDDTWVGGGHSESAAAALKLAGAGRVSLLNVARWLEPNDELTADFLPEHFDKRAYDPQQCPWTGDGCP